MYVNFACNAYSWEVFKITAGKNRNMYDGILTVNSANQSTEFFYCTII
jgi:hypothetical protein